MRINRRTLIASATAAMFSGTTSGYGDMGVRLPARLWRSRRSAELVAIGQARYRRFTMYDRALALVEEGSLAELENETLAAHAMGEDSLELEYWGQVTCFNYDRVPAWAEAPRYGDDRRWSRNLRLTLDAFFQIWSEHFAFAAERGVDWSALRAECDAALARKGLSRERLFDALAGVLRVLDDGHGSLEDADSSAKVPRAVQVWRMAGGRTSEEDAWDDFIGDGAEHVYRCILAGEGRSAARDGLAWGQLPTGLGYIALMRCQDLAPNGSGRADVSAVDAALDRALGELADAHGMIVDLRFNDGGWDRVGLALASRFADRAMPAFTKHAVRSGAAVELQAIATTPALGRRHTGPVAVLTSDATISAAEVATLALRALPNVRVLGWPTYGALSDEMDYCLPNGWEGTLSNEVYTASDGQVYEGRGIPPAQEAAELSADDFWNAFDAPLRDAAAWLASGEAEQHMP